jgi:hypothetical protein
MPNNTATERPFHEIPNSQVLDAADQFHDGYTLMMAAGAAGGVLLPALHCASIAMELYLKALSAREIEVPFELGGAYIYAKAPAKSHKLEDLYNEAPADFRSAIDAEIAKHIRLSKYSGGSAALAAHNAMFMSSRYPFEPQSKLDGIEMNALNELLGSLRKAIRSIPPRFDL